MAGCSQPQSTLAPVGAATSDHARPVGPKHDRSPEQMQVHTYSVHTVLIHTTVWSLAALEPSELPLDRASFKGSSLILLVNICFVSEVSEDEYFA